MHVFIIQFICNIFSYSRMPFKTFHVEFTFRIHNFSVDSVL